MDIIGHQKQLNILQKSLEKNNISQAHFFYGPENVGKFTIALNFAQKLINAKEDIFVVKPEINPARNASHSDAGGEGKKKDIKIEQVKDLQHWLSRTSLGGGFKVAVIDDAQKLNKSAQNALLKILEEPNEKSLLILVANDEKKIFSTIISRCLKIGFGTVSESELKKNIPDNLKNKEEIIFWSLGKPGILLNLINDERQLVFRKESLKEFKNIFSQNISEKFYLADNFSKNANLAIEKLNLWVIILRQSLMDNSFGFSIDSSRKIPLMEKLEESINLLKNTNSNPKLVLENLFLAF